MSMLKPTLYKVLHLTGTEPLSNLERAIYASPEQKEWGISALAMTNECYTA